MSNPVHPPSPPPAYEGPGGAVLDDLVARGLVQDSTDSEALRERLDAGPVSLYCGFDPTADSLHIGHLVPILLLRRFQQYGHRPIALAGGATGMIGDPSGRSDERNLLDREALDHNVGAIEGQLRRLLDFGDDPGQAVLVDNRQWTEPVGVLDFLRDVGKHITVNTMLAKESVRARVASDNGISFTEFSYMLLQANDYRWLHDNLGCDLQAGGSDQWGNITAGIDLVRRTSGARVHGLTVPLITRSDGAKFGKTAAGAVWLAPERTSPYEFFQYWMKTDDRDVERFLLQMTLLPVDEVRDIAARHAQAPEERWGQRALAQAVTALVHGEAEAAAASGASADFTKDASERSMAELQALAGEVPTTEIPRDRLLGGMTLIDLLVEIALASSKSDARRQLEQKGVYINDVQQSMDRTMNSEDFLHGTYVLVRRGKRSRHLVVVAD